jgi:hypothetical protein
MGREEEGDEFKKAQRERKCSPASPMRQHLLKKQEQFRKGWRVISFRAP